MASASTSAGRASLGAGTGILKVFFGWNGREM
jgi:hypothetical protein